MAWISIIILVLLLRESSPFRYNRGICIGLIPKRCIRSHNQDDIPLHTYSPVSPLETRIHSVDRLTQHPYGMDTYLIKLKYSDEFNFLEGQSVGVIPSRGKFNPQKANLHTRLYSIASSRCGEEERDILSLCVKRVVDPEAKIRGKCSNYLCDRKEGDLVHVVGPMGANFLLPNSHFPWNHAVVNMSASIEPINLIFVVTGTGIAPVRAMIRRVYHDSCPTSVRKIWLIAGAHSASTLPFHEEWINIGKKDPSFRYSTAFSGEQFTTAGHRLHVQDILKQNSEEIVNQLSNHGAAIYFCGRQDMMPPILQIMREQVVSMNMDWKSTIEGWRDSRRWSVEVY